MGGWGYDGGSTNDGDGRYSSGSSSDWRCVRGYREDTGGCESVNEWILLGERKQENKKETLHNDWLYDCVWGKKQQKRDVNESGSRWKKEQNRTTKWTGRIYRGREQLISEYLFFFWTPTWPSALECTVHPTVFLTVQYFVFVLAVCKCTYKHNASEIGNYLFFCYCPLFVKKESSVSSIKGLRINNYIRQIDRTQLFFGKRNYLEAKSCWAHTLFTFSKPQRNKEWIVYAINVACCIRWCMLRLPDVDWLWLILSCWFRAARECYWIIILCWSSLE